jgi:ABC-2 type transport system ATP-binding protein
MTDSRVVLEGVHKGFHLYHSRDLKSAGIRLLRRQKVTDRLEVLRGVSFSIQPGERVGIVGRNGAGKSTLFRLLSGIQRPDSGRVEVRGRLAPLIELTAGLHPDLTGRDNLLINGAVLGLSRSEVADRYEKIVDFAEIHDFMDTPCRYYSSGMKARLGFSIAVHVDADVVLIDEALAVGDAAFQQKCVSRMLLLAEQGASVVFVSHELPMLRRFCERLIWLEDGRVRLDGPCEDVLEEYERVVADT